MNILLVAVKKSFTKKWLSHESPTLKAWMEITMDIYKLEKIKAMLNLKLEQFVLCWKKWTKYATSQRPDFIF